MNFPRRDRPTQASEYRHINHIHKEDTVNDGEHGVEMRGGEGLDYNTFDSFSTPPPVLTDNSNTTTKHSNKHNTNNKRSTNNTNTCNIINNNNDEGDSESEGVLLYELRQEF